MSTTDTRVAFVDQSLRDGQQSLWGMRMRAGHALPVAHLIDQAGFDVDDVTGSSMIEVLVRHHHENPWEGLDLLREAMPTATLRAGTRSNGAVAASAPASSNVWPGSLQSSTDPHSRGGGT